MGISCELNGNTRKMGIEVSNSGDFSNSNAGIVVISWDMGIYSGNIKGNSRGFMKVYFDWMGLKGIEWDLPPRSYLGVCVCENGVKGIHTRNSRTNREHTFGWFWLDTSSNSCHIWGHHRRIWQSVHKMMRICTADRNMQECVSNHHVDSMNFCDLGIKLDKGMESGDVHSSQDLPRQLQRYKWGQGRGWLALLGSALLNSSSGWSCSSSACQCWQSAPW